MRSPNGTRVSSKVEYTSWRGMCDRCHRQRASNYAKYGGRGVTVFSEWRGVGGFKRFLAYIGPSPGDGYTVERLDGSRGYVPGNVIWATRATQSRNRPGFCITITYMDKTQTLAEWGRELGIAYETLRSRMKRKLPLNLLFEVGRSRSSPQKRPR